jgi:hypothetical protein
VVPETDPMSGVLDRWTLERGVPRQDAVDYDAIAKGANDVAWDLCKERGRVASAVGVSPARVVIDPVAIHRGRVTVITSDRPVREPRYHTRPRAEDGVLHGIGRRADGSGDADVMVWDRLGMISTAVVGARESGKTTALRVLARASASGSQFNLMYGVPSADPDPWLARHARVVVIGRRNVLKMHRLVEGILARREGLVSTSALWLRPSLDMPGWTVMHEQFGVWANDPAGAHRWIGMLGRMHRGGMWGVATNRTLFPDSWGGKAVRDAWSEQVIAFRASSVGEGHLDTRLGCNPAELPADDAGEPLPGMAIHTHRAMPVRWDTVPQQSTCPPQPDPPAADVAALEEVLGEAVDGRWRVGGPDATHTFPSGLI